MKRWILVLLGVLLAIAGIVWTLQGLNLLGQSGGMDGQTIWVVIGLITVLAGLVLVTIGARAGRSRGRSPAPR